MRRFILPVSLLLLMSSPAWAMDLRLANPYLHKVEWNQLYLSKQMQGAVYLRAEIEKLEQENEQLRNSINNLRNVAVYQSSVKNDSRIQALVEENKRLTSMLVSKGNQKNIPINNKLLNERDAKILSLQGAFQELQDENRKLAQALASSSAKMLDYQDEMSIARSDSSINAGSVTILKGKLEQVEGENKTLRSEISKIKAKLSVATTSGQNGIEALKKQSQSLRATIAAQNKGLLSADNASKTAERLLSENKMLQVRLKRIENTKRLNDEGFKELIARNKRLQSEIAGRDDYIKRLIGLKETVKLLRAENDKYASKQIVSDDSKELFKELQSRNEELKADIDKAQEDSIAYRTKIREYQDELGALKLADEELVALKLENQELNARIKLIEKIDLKEEYASKIIDNKKEIVAFVAAPYPPVEQVAPILNKDGDHISYNDTAALNPEDILAQNIKPLSGL